MPSWFFARASVESMVTLVTVQTPVDELTLITKFALSLIKFPAIVRFASGSSSFARKGFRSWIWCTHITTTSETRKACIRLEMLLVHQAYIPHLGVGFGPASLWIWTHHLSENKIVFSHIIPAERGCSFVYYINVLPNFTSPGWVCLRINSSIDPKYLFSFTNPRNSLILISWVHEIGFALLKYQLSNLILASSVFRQCSAFLNQHTLPFQF